MYQIARYTTLAAAIGLVVGCGSNDNTKPAFANVSGTVTYNGQPLPSGDITFTTDGRSPSSMKIVDGKFAGQAMIGSNKVSVSAFRKSNKERKIPPGAKKQYDAYRAMNKGGGGGTSEMFDPSMEDYIPDEWGRESNQMRVVEPGVPNNFQFDIKPK